MDSVSVHWELYMSATDAVPTKRTRRRRPEAAIRIAARRRRRKEAAVSAAAELLDKHGPHKLSLRAVARSIDCAPATLYEYFANKDELLEALAEKPRAELQRYLDAALADSNEMASDLLIRLAIAYVRFAQRNRDGFRLLFETLAPRTATSQSPFDTYPVLRPLLDVTRTGQMTGEIDQADDPERIAWGLWALAHGLAVLRSAAVPIQTADVDGTDVSVLQAYIGGWLV